MKSSCSGAWASVPIASLAPASSARRTSSAPRSSRGGLAVIDVSFISLKLVLPALIDIVDERAEIVVLVKPQFEVGAEKLPSDGVVKNETDRDAVLQDLRTFINRETPWSVVNEMPSPIKGERQRQVLPAHEWDKSICAASPVRANMIISRNPALGSSA